MPELLLELFSEEIPARMQARAKEDLARLLGEGLKKNGLSFERIRSFATPRRLTAVVDGLPPRSPEISEEKKGPRVDAPEAAIKGFLKAAGLSTIDQAERREDKKGAYYVATLSKPGRATPDVVAEIVPEIVRSFPWPKSMRWGAGRLYWVRPLHSILCLYDGEVVRFEIDAIASGDETRGHRFLAPEPFAVKSFDDYLRKLREAYVVLDAEERQSIILDRAHALAANEAMELVEDAALLAENAGLTEWPVPLIGAFDASFLEVPPEVLTTSMKAHQKCFSLRVGGASRRGLAPAPQHGAHGKAPDPHPEEARSAVSKDEAKLANRFIMVANLEASDGGRAIVAGNERVIRARLSDAKFFFDQDRKVPLETRVPKLKEVVFHDKLGTQYDRIQRIWRLAREIAPLVGAEADLAERAAILAKADLISDMVGEFPELQGVMGRYYALDQEEDPVVADAIAAHYKPLGPSDEVPREPVAIAVALADKLDTLTGFWAIDEKPTGSKDPYALRRAALGVIRIVLENSVSFTSPLEGEVDRTRSGREGGKSSRANSQPPSLALPRKGGGDASGAGIRIPLRAMLRAAYNAIDDAIARRNDESMRQGGHQEMVGLVPGERSIADLLAFFADRLKVHLRDQGARHDLIDAVFALAGQDDLLMIVARVEALGRFLDTDDGANLLIGTKRAINILRIEEKKDGMKYDQPPDPKLFELGEEKALAKTIDQVERDAAAAIGKEDFEAAMAAMAKLRAPVDQFFDHVTVNADDAKLRANRLRLLSRIRAATLQVADFSKIEG